MHTTLLSPFLKRVAAGCPCRERHGDIVAGTPPVRVGLLACADSNKVAVKSPVVLRWPGVGRERVPMSSKTLSWDKRCTCCATKHPRMSDSALFVCSSFIVTHCNSVDMYEVGLRLVKVDFLPLLAYISRFEYKWPDSRNG